MSGKQSKGGRRATVVEILLVLVVVAALANIAVLILYNNSYSMERWGMEYNLKKNKVKYTREMDLLIEEKNFITLASYIRERDIDYSEYFIEYRCIADGVAQLQGLAQCVSQLRDNAGYRTKAESVSRLAAQIDGLFSVQKYYREYSERYLDSTPEVLDEIFSQAAAFVACVFDLSEEEFFAFESMEKSRIEIILGKKSGLYD